MNRCTRIARETHHCITLLEYNGELGMFARPANVSKVVEILVKRGADINAQNNSGHTSLHVAQREEANKACLLHVNDHSFYSASA